MVGDAAATTQGGQPLPGVAQVAIQQGLITIEPELGADQYSSTSVDLTLASEIRIWRAGDTGDGQILTLSPGDLGYDHKAIADRHTEVRHLEAEGHVLRPGDFILAWTLENVVLPTH